MSALAWVSLSALAWVKLYDDTVKVLPRVCTRPESRSKLTCTSQHTEASAVEIATEAAAIEHDIRTGNLKAGVSQLAALGGKSKTNCSRDYHRRMSNKEDLELYWVKVPLVCGEVEVPMLLPHELLSFLWSLGWTILSGVLLGGVLACTVVAFAGVWSVQ